MMSDKANGTGTNTPTSAKDGNLYFECVNCNRQVCYTSNTNLYCESDSCRLRPVGMQHISPDAWAYPLLAGGRSEGTLNQSMRLYIPLRSLRANLRDGSRPSSDAGRSVSPPSDTGNASEDNTKLKGKGKSKVKRVGEFKNCLVRALEFLLKHLPSDEADFTLKRKRVRHTIFCEKSV